MLCAVIFAGMLIFSLEQNESNAHCKSNALQFRDFHISLNTLLNRSQIRREFTNIPPIYFHIIT